MCGYLRLCLVFVRSFGGWSCVVCLVFIPGPTLLAFVAFVFVVVCPGIC